MTLPTFVPGYLGTVTLNSDDISAIGQVVSLKMSRNSLSKPVFGSQWRRTLAGQRSGTFSANGHVSVEQLADLHAAFASDAPIPFVMQIGDAAGPTDSGTYGGNCNVTDYTIEADADDEWKWSIDAATDGVVTYTPATP